MSFEVYKRSSFPIFFFNWKPMAGYTGLRSCTWTEFPAHVYNNSSLMAQGSAASNFDLTLLTCLLIGSYRFCIIPLLAAFNGKDGKLWSSKWDWMLNHNWDFFVSVVKWFKELLDIFISYHSEDINNINMFCMLDINSAIMFINLICICWILL